MISCASASIAAMTMRQPCAAGASKREIGGDVAQHCPAGAESFDELVGGDLIELIGLAAVTRHVRPPHTRKPPLRPKGARVWWIQRRCRAVEVTTVKRSEAAGSCNG